MSRFGHLDRVRRTRVARRSRTQSAQLARQPLIGEPSLGHGGDPRRTPRPGPAPQRPRRVLADKAYSSQANRAWLRAHRIRTTIPVTADQAAHRRARGSRGGRPPAFDSVTHKNCSTVERGFSHLKHHRALAIRYDKLAVRYQATIHIARIDHWLKGHT